MTTVTVVLCTYNRSGDLLTALTSLAAMEVPESMDWEVLVIDNNSADQTREVVERFCTLYPRRFRYVFEPRQGLCNARNAGVREARGEVIAFTDDDVIVEAKWLRNLTTALHDGRWAGAGGRIQPLWSSPPPKWLAIGKSYNMGGVLALLDLGDEPMELTAAPYGANMAFQKDMFQKYGAFRADLDRCGRGMLSNGDTEFGSRLLTAGERLRYEPTAVVHHSVGEKRLTRGYFLAWWFSKGRSDIRQYGIRPGTKRFCLRIPLYLFRGMVISTMRWMLTTSPQQRFSHKLTVWAQLGAIVECFESRRAAVKGSREPLYPAA